MIVKRLDDVNDEVRVLALAALAAIPESLPSEKEAKFSPECVAFVGDLVEKILVHMDDKDEHMRSEVLGRTFGKNRFFNNNGFAFT